MGARLGGSFEQSLVHAHEAGQVGQPLRDPELALDRDIDPPVHPALDRLIDSAREVWPAAGSRPRRCAISFSTAAVWLSVAAMIRRPCGREPRGRARSGKPSRRYPASPSGDRGRPAEGASAPPGWCGEASRFTSMSSARLAPSFRCSSPRTSACLVSAGDQPVLQFQASATRGHGLVPAPFAIFAALRRAFEFVLGLVLAIFALLPGSARLAPAPPRPRFGQGRRGSDKRELRIDLRRVQVQSSSSASCMHTKPVRYGSPCGIPTSSSICPSMRRSIQRSTARSMPPASS